MAADALAVAPLLVPLLSATAALLTRRWPVIRTSVSVAGVVAYAGVVALVAWRVVVAPDAPGAVAYQVGDWPAPYGITLVVDALSAFVLVLTAAVALPAMLSSVRYLLAEDEDVYYHPLYHFLLVGITGALLTGDLFNLFVWFEVLLMASYVLIAFYGGVQHTRATLWFLVLNIVASAVMLVAIGGLYATTGTLNMADMAQRLAQPEAYGVAVGPVVGLSALLFAVFALKAGIVPFQFWVPSAYTAAPLPATALLAGAVKKVGIYAILRLYFTVFSEASVPVSLPGTAGDSPLAFLGPVLLLMAAASVVFGGVGAVRGRSIEEVLAFSSIGQVGFIAIPVAIAALVPPSAPGVAGLSARELAIAAALVYALNHTLAKGMLFLAAATVRSATGTSRLSELGGLAGRFPALSSAFMVGALALIGIPPLSGFFGKFLVFDAAVRADRSLTLAVLVGGSVLTIAYTTRAWLRAFWGERTAAVETADGDPGQVAVVVVMALGVVAVGVGFEVVFAFAEAAAEAATDTDAYVDLVAPTGGVEE
ncbi:complex I subunit 5 family protein [Halomicrobium salinisoli]|uniref:complex I subunit 5 family protein n=1 Tax=Halomicrobium salinisoli TaxID=2878391 RepID=UPI001CEFCE78|nr:proton-conducting transporter membrane subunit [Halomicrobium salinisoli]